MVFSLVILVSSHLVSVANRNVNVYDTSGELIGEAVIPHNYAFIQNLALMFFILSGLLCWIVFHFGKRVLALEYNP